MEPEGELYEYNLLYLRKLTWQRIIPKCHHSNYHLPVGLLNNSVMEPEGVIYEYSLYTSGSLLDRESFLNVTIVTTTYLSAY